MEKKFYCPNCKKDITDSEGTIDSDVSGFIDNCFECEDCDISIYTWKIEKGVSHYWGDD